MSSKIETRTFSLRAEGQAGDPEYTLRGYAATFGTLSKDLGGFREIIKRGAFKKLLAGNPDVRFLLNHDASKVMGHTAAGTLTLAQDDKGLRFVCQLDPRQQSHRDLHAAIQRRDISDCSFSFKLEPGDDAYDDATDEETGKRFCRRSISNFSHLYDVSAVTAPAYEGTSVAARSLQPLSFEQQLFNRGIHYYPARVIPTDAELRAKAILQAKQIREDSFRNCSAVHFNGRYFEATAWDTDKITARAQELAAERNQLYINDWAQRFVASQTPMTGIERNRLRREVEWSIGDAKAQANDWLSVRCKGGSLTATADDHRGAAEAHGNMARRSKDLSGASSHYGAADAHRAAAYNLTQETASTALRACNACWSNEQKAMYSATKES